MSYQRRRFAWRITRDLVAFGLGLAIGAHQAFVAAEPNAGVLTFAGGLVALAIGARVEESKRDRGQERQHDDQVR